MSKVNEERLIDIAKEIVIVTDGREEKRNDSVNYTICKLGELKKNESDYEMFKNWFEEVAGHQLEIGNIDEIIEILAKYLISKGIKVPEKSKYETEQYNSISKEEFFRNWGSDDISSGRRR